jgi:putative DNA primase/helicase
MQYFSHIPLQILSPIVRQLTQDKQKYDKAETYVKALIDHFYGNGDGRPWFYSQGHFKILDDLKNEAEIADFIYRCGGNPTQSKVSGVLYQLSRIAKPVPNAEVGLNVANGFLELNGGQVKLLPHDEARGQRYVLPFEYNPSSSCPLWSAFLQRVLPDPVVREYLQDFFGYILLGGARPNAECFAVWKGEGANGKSVALAVLQILIGHENYSSLSLHELTPRNTESLINKIANIGSETERSAALQTSVLKRMVSLEPILAEPKYRPHYSFVSSAVPVFAVNDLPPIDDRTDGIWRRMHLIKWSVTIPENERDTTLSKKLQGEIEGILIWAIQGAQRVLARGLVVPKQVREATATIRLEANNIAMFCSAVVEKHDDYYVSKDDLYQAYSAWCKRNGYKAVGLINFAKELKRSIPSVGESKSRSGYVDWRGREVMTRVNVWTGIHVPEDQVEREVSVNGRREVLVSAIGSKARLEETVYGLRAAA